MADFNDERFVGYDNKRIKVTKTGKKAEVKIKNDDYIANGASLSASIYGNITIPNETSKKIKWRIKCIKSSSREFWAVGICSAQHKYYDNFYYRQTDTISYAYKANGQMFQCGEWIQDKKISGWDEGDIITLCYDGINREISISINNKHEQISTLKVKDNPQGFKLCVFMGCPGDKVEIVGFECEEQESKSNQTSSKTDETKVAQNAEILFIHFYACYKNLHAVILTFSHHITSRRRQYQRGKQRKCMMIIKSMKRKINIKKRTRRSKTRILMT